MSTGPDYAPLPMWLMRRRDITSSTKLVYGRLKLFTNKETGTCNPSHKTLADETGLSVSQVKRSLAELRAERLLIWRRTRTSSFYAISEIAQNELSDSSKRADKIAQNELQKDVFEKKSYKRESLSVSSAESAPLFGGVLAFVSDTLNRPIIDSAKKRLTQQLREIPLTEERMIDVLQEAIARSPSRPRTLSWFAGTLRKHLWDRQQQAFPPSVSRPANGWMDQDEVDGLAEAFGG